MVVYTFLRERAKRLLAREFIVLNPKQVTPSLYFAKFTFSEMLPTALPYHTPAKLSRAFFVRRHTTGQQRQGSSPTPRPPQGGSATSGVWRQGKPAVYRHPKNCTAALDNNKRLWYSIGATDGVWRESVRTSKRANPQGLALFLFAPAGRPMQRPHGAC